METSTKDVLQVNYGGAPCYNIVFRYDFTDLFEQIASLEGQKYSRICIVSDSNVAKIYTENVISTFNNSTLVPKCQISTFVIEAGEPNKTLDSVKALYEHLIKEKFTRSDLLIALGGGVIGDMTGFTAATYLRGIDFVQVPTSLLAMVDSSVGGKTGVDFDGYKNMVGAFYMPRLVYMNLSVLKTLPEEQFACGMGEVIKYGFIKDKTFLDWLSNNKDFVKNKNIDALKTIVYNSCLYKKIIVENDPTEKGERGLLNFGHTIGHAIEKLSNFKLFHGQCVSIGMVAALELCVKRALIDHEELDNALDILASYNLPINTEASFSAGDILLATKSDKKMVGNTLKFIILSNIGTGVIVKDVSDEELIYAIEKVIA